MRYALCKIVKTFSVTATHKVKCNQKLGKELTG
jgi:hypothetical protein